MAESGVDTSHVEFSELLDQHRLALLRFATTLAPAANAEDLVQDAFEQAWRNRSRYDPSRGSVRVWLFGILANAGRHVRRTTEGQIRLAEALEDVGPGVVVSSESVVDLRAAINVLPDRQRAVVILFYYVDLSIADIAALLNLATGTVSSTLHDARNSLATKLGTDYAQH